MSTRISDGLRIGAALALLSLLPGCIGGGGGTGGAPAEAVVTSDLVVIAGPPGFCVDESATRADGDTAFVLLGNCAAISNSRRAAQPAVPVVLTAAISDASDEGSISESLSDLDAYFRSEEGLALLSRTQDAGTVTVLETATEGDVFLLHASDTSGGAVEGVGDDYWRAYFDIDRRIATLSVLALEDRGVSREDSLSALRQFARTVMAANAATPEAVAGMPAQTAEAPPPQGGLFNVGLFRRIFD
ncbi:hypothetical protein N8I71_05980 [Roseibacterium sp. SDUM158016]|uniref:hypothetical protein n=1 Tax=Roseicyclus sediminis TaxID=2980997 RepID=UPI0021CEB727|nr:hypothetical protein [Roseibacterium sp. SDUM158016]MCU4652370.1 hypothetical protein [Roseibacterium sp. SDUM158016]